ncbi:MAG: histidine kinase [Firmicutes bacterium]|nr:histidine kinase [Bacillota bacterium]
MIRKPGLDMKGIDRIFQQTVAALRSGRDEISGIAQAAQAEYERLRIQSEEIRQEAAVCVKQVDFLEKQLQKAKTRLAVVNRDFERYGEEEIKQAYQEAQALQVEVAVAREREAALRRKRDELDRSLRNLAKLVAKAEGMVKQVGAAMNILAGNLEDALVQIEGLQEKSILATRIIQAQEDERRRVARDIHDGPAQSMANVVLRAEICERLLDAERNELAQELAELKTMVKKTLVDVRRIIFNLRPMALDDLGLAPTLRRFMESVREETGIAADLIVLGKEQRLPQTVEVTVFRLIQEAVNNARKHAKSTRILVRLEFTDNQINTQVEDNGIGFNMEEAREKARNADSFGLMSMSERVDLLGGELRIVSTPGIGTTVSACIPLASIEE